MTKENSPNQDNNAEPSEPTELDETVVDEISGGHRKASVTCLTGDSFFNAAQFSASLNPDDENIDTYDDADEDDPI